MTTNNEIHIKKISDKYYGIGFGDTPLPDWDILLDFEQMKEIAKQLKEMGF